MCFYKHLKGGIILDKKIKGAKKLLKDIEQKKKTWNERSNFVLKGIKNLSMSDLDTLILYAETFIQNNNFNELMFPVEEIQEVLKRYEIID